MDSIHDVTKYIQQQFPKVIESENTEMTKNKLRRLIYHCQSYSSFWSLQFFDEKTKKDFANADISNVHFDLSRGNSANLTEELKEIINAVVPWVTCIYGLNF